MKKILLTSLMLAALLCLLAISVFAEDIVVSKTENAEYGTVIQLSADPGLDEAAKYVSFLNKIEDAGTDKDALCVLTDGTYFYVFPSSYIVNEREDGVFDLIATQLSAAMVEFNTANSTSYYAGYSVNGGNAGKRLEAVVRFEFPSDVTTTSDTVCCMRAYPKLVEIRVLHSIDLSANQMFYNNGALTTAIGIENATAIGTNMFMFCRKLQSASIPVDTVKIPNGMFFGCGTNASVVFTILNLSECTQLTTIGEDVFRDSGKISIAIPDSVTTIEARAFQAGCKTGSVTISQSSKLQVIGDNAFNSCTAITTLYIPSTVNQIGEHAFHGCSGMTALENFENCQITVLKASTFEGVTSMKTIKIPKNVTIIENAFIGNKSLTTVYIPNTVTSISNTFVNSTWENQPVNAVYIYTGKDASLFADCKRFEGANIISASEYDENAKYTGINLVLGFSHCIAYNDGIHAEKVSDTVVTSYLESIKIVSKCVLCEMTEDNDSISPLFTCLGYSVAERGNAGIVISFKVNSRAIDEYEEISKKTVEYGLFAVAKDRLGENDIFDANGNAATGVINAEMSRNNFAIFDLKITGISDEQKDSKLAFGAYVAVSDEEATEYSYLQIDTANNGEKYNFTSYNEILNSLA